MKSLRNLGLGLLAMTLAGAADAARRSSYGSGVTGTTGVTPSMRTPPAQPFRPYRPYRYQSTYGGDPTSLTPRRRPYESSGPGGFKRFENGFKPYGSQDAVRSRAGTFDQEF
ncbi:hypothetical protein [Phenylobacterium sp.]|jgi:hypothetical protein|uniref:hypothetical protein n=1 Tax=Phenylobacterium sp. TaxID=1871053 RepID=UPI002F3E37E6